MIAVLALVTGGCGFIGSAIAERLLGEGHAVRVLDDLSTGFIENLDSRAEFVLGDVADLSAMREAMENIDVVFHEAAFRSVIGSIDQPLVSDRSNTHGTLAVLTSAADAGVRRVVCASSSSVYGGVAALPSAETAIAEPKSPYAVSKLAGEHYCRVFAELHRLETVVLRYFNVFGPRQRPDSRYAAVIPLFVKSLLQKDVIEIHGDGRQSRDFTYVDDVVTANLLAANAPGEAVKGRVFNVARGETHSLLELVALLAKLTGVDPEVVHSPPRAGDIRHSQADVTAVQSALNFIASVPFEEGLRRAVKWFAATHGIQH